jgi:DNA-binding transcriptional MerR regulator/effector-binding domain-containing protein
VMEFLIGEFSVMTRVTVKTLRFYHEQGILLPSRIDSVTGYRYYDKNSVEQIRIIKLLRDFDFSIGEIRHVVDECREDGDIYPVLETKAKEVRESAALLREKTRRLDELICRIRDEKNIKVPEGIGIKQCDEELAATIRYRGKYSDCGIHLGRLYQAVGGAVKGKPFALYHDNEYQEDNADIEVGVPVRKPVTADGMECKSIQGGKVAFTIHRGAYETLSASYGRLMEYVKEANMKSYPPIREIYLQGPGMIFRGNPKQYLTEIRMPVE